MTPYHPMQLQPALLPTAVPFGREDLQRAERFQMRPVRAPFRPAVPPATEFLKGCLEAGRSAWPGRRPPPTDLGSPALNRIVSPRQQAQPQELREAARPGPWVEEAVPRPVTVQAWVAVAPE